MPPSARASSATVANERKKTVAITATIPSSSTPTYRRNVLVRLRSSTCGTATSPPGGCSAPSRSATRRQSTPPRWWRAARPHAVDPSPTLLSAIVLGLMIGYVVKSTRKRQAATPASGSSHWAFRGRRRGGSEVDGKAALG